MFRTLECRQFLAEDTYCEIDGHELCPRQGLAPEVRSVVGCEDTIGGEASVSIAQLNSYEHTVTRVVFFQRN